jgi:Ser/Thr protein kinase RdoA (MazF antagonist)
MRPPTVPLRVAHFDAKADNFVVDDGGRVRALIDLDTVMSGSWLWDVGDLARSTTGTRAEDEPDDMAFDGDRFAALIDGYRGETDPILTATERDGLALAPLIVTFEQAVRFLTDHLAGDVYYRVARTGHNLDRCRAQLALLESMADQLT